MKMEMTTAVIVLSVCLAGSLFVSDLAARAVPQDSSDRDRADLLDTAKSAGNFRTLLEAVAAAGLTETLRGDGPFTVLAPSDAAFSNLPASTLEGLLDPGNREQLRRVLAFHVIDGRVDSTSALRAGTAQTLAGEPLDFALADGRLRVADATVIANDIAASNGVIHVIDSVLLPPSDERSPAEAAFDVLQTAVERGAFFFNNGQAPACVAVYEVAAISLLSLSDALTERSRDVLRQALDAGGSSADPVRRAWDLRHAIDAVSIELSNRISDEASLTRAGQGPNRGPVSPNTSVSTPVIRPLFDFEGPAASKWFSVNDDVMGGISRGSFSLHDDGIGVFSGALSLANNGGFATIRSRATDFDLDGFQGVVLRVRGDGRTYHFSALTGDARSEVRIWESSFDTVAGEWAEVRIPFDNLELTVMGRRFPDVPPIAPDSIRSFGFAIKDKNQSPFRLEVDWVKAYRAEEGT